MRYGNGILEGNKLIHAVGHHLARKAEADEKSEPLVKSGIVGAFAVECRPDGSRDYRKHQHAKEQDPIESFVAATTAGVDERFAHAKNMRGRPENNRADRPESRRIGNVEVGDGEKAGEDLRGQTINAEVYETESEGHASREAPSGRLPFRMSCVRAKLLDLGSCHAGTSTQKLVSSLPQLTFRIFTHGAQKFLAASLLGFVWHQATI